MPAPTRTLALAVLAALGHAANPAHAAPLPAPAAQGGLEEVVVTAQRREENLQETPVTVTALTAESLANAQIDSTQDVAKVVPNLKFLPVTASRSTLQVSLRGGSEQAGGLVTSESAVAFYVDDVYRGRLAGSNLELADVERIEVLRGPQGTLYGRNSFSGAVKVVTRSPLDRDWLEVSAGVGEFDERRIAATAGGALGGGAFGLSASALYRERDGFIRNLALGRDVYGERNAAFRTKLQWGASDAFRGTLGVTLTRDDNDGPANLVPITVRPGVTFPAAGPANPGLFITSDDLVPLAGQYASFSPYAPEGRTDQNVVSLDLGGTFGNGLGWRSITAWIDTDDDFAFDLSGGRADPDGTFRIAGLARASTAESRQLSQELHLTGTQDRLDWIVGLYAFKEDSEQRLTDVLGLAPGVLLSVLPQTIDTETRSLAAFAQGTWRATDRLSLTLGLRYTQDEKELDGTIQNRLPFGPGPAIALVPVRATPDFDSFTPRLGVEFAFSEAVFGYASYSEGFKAGGFNGLAVANPAVFSTVYGPQNVKAVEVGLKSTLFGEALLANVAVFRNELEDLQQTIQIGPGSFSVQNVGDSRVDGLELELATRSFAGFSAFLNLGLIDDEYRGLAPQSEAAINGARRLPLTSEWNYRVGFAYDSPPLAGGGWRVTAGADWTEVGDYFSVVNNRLKTKGWGTLDARVGLVSADDRWAVTLQGRNLTDEWYFTTAATSDAVAVGDPRTWFLGVTFRQ